tara:strand:- start:3309 stop:3554 length:246 start_codon:yes stop_codon:yes gene_type:complete
MELIEGCHSLKLECALRNLGFVDVGWKCIAHAGLFFIEPVGIPDDPEGDLLGFHIINPKGNSLRLSQTAKQALDVAIRWSG